ncbi:MAG: Ppx/GppA phosphatase family protein [Pseudomonadota bacterium]
MISSQRPEQNTDGADERRDPNAPASPNKSRKKRRRNRKRRDKSGVQAQSHDNSAPMQPGADNTSAPSAPTMAATMDEGPRADKTRPDHQAKPVRQTERPGKRRRRNRHKRGEHLVETRAESGTERNTGQRQDSLAVENRRHGPKAAVAERGRRGPNSNQRSDAKTGKKPHKSYAALDLGTNNCRLLIATPLQPGRFRVVDAFSRIVRLGEGLAASGELSEQAMTRAVGALKACAEKLKGRNIDGVRLIATEACRRARNGGEFLRRVEEEAGLKLEIVDRETEARLAVSGCASLVDRKASGAVLFDIGGGSSELALLDLKKRRRHDFGPAMVSWTSLPFGVVTLSEKHGGGRHVTRAVFQDMVDEVADHLTNFEGRDALEQAAKAGEVHLLGTSGTVTTLAGIHLKLPRYDRRQVDGTWMASSQVGVMIETLLDMSFEQRMENPCIGRDRADLVLAGCAILAAIQKQWPCERLRVADRGLREGLLTEMMNADNAWLRRNSRFRARTKGQA